MRIEVAEEKKKILKVTSGQKQTSKAKRMKKNQAVYQET